MGLNLLTFAARLLASESVVDRIIWTSEPYESLYFRYADNNYSLYKNEPGLIEFIKESVCNLECNETKGPCLFNNYLPAYYNEDLCTIVKEYGVSREEWMSKVEDMSYLAFEDQCSPANPRVPMVEDIKQILIDAFDNKEFL